ncbi:hypothetical protein AJ79_06383 [Helicocarpus griseus UAMH5409]|uniref:Uncharacterized protein n=1 Tax=Helicocarpus griseus UAMH5409 TaxID=1447875 RepID=A0A2B7X619_9EURO|nr:hypothetical protein AJ79_06383 [Helicocarpus griseus UAMH5409]
MTMVYNSEMQVYIDLRKTRGNNKPLGSLRPKTLHEMFRKPMYESYIKEDVIPQPSETLGREAFPYVATCWTMYRNMVTVPNLFKYSDFENGSLDTSTIIPEDLHRCYLFLRFAWKQLTKAKQSNTHHIKPVEKIEYHVDSINSEEEQRLTSGIFSLDAKRMAALSTNFIECHNSLDAGCGGDQDAFEIDPITPDENITTILSEADISDYTGELPESFSNPTTPCEKLPVDIYPASAPEPNLDENLCEVET